MASLALQVVGTAIGGPIGGAIGGMIGGLIDNVLFPSKQQAPPKITSSTYGEAIPLPYGPYTRLGCNLIWTSGWRKQKASKNIAKAILGGAAAGKGGKGVSAYECDVAFGVAAGELEPDWCRKLFANGTNVFDADAATSTPTPDGDGVVTWDLSHESHVNFDTITVYPGNLTQGPDPTLEAALGAGNVPAYRGLAYIVISGLQGTPFGNSVPLLNVIVRAQAEISLGAVCADICERSGIDPLTVSTSSLTRDVGGYAITAQSDGLSALQPLALCYDFDVAEVGGGLRFSARGQAPLAKIVTDQLAGREAGQERPSWEWPREPETQMPKTASLTFIDPDRDGNANTQSAQRETGSANSNLSTRVEVTLTSDAARAICDRMLWEAQVGRQSLKATTDDRLNWLESGRNVDVAGFGNVRITKKTRGANGVIEIEAKRDYAAIYRSTALSQSADPFPNPLLIGGPVNPPIFVEPPSGFPGIDQATLLIGVSGGDGTDANPAWQGCQVWVSTDDVTGDYTLAGVVLGPACMGKTTGTLASYGGANPDTANTLAVDTSESLGEPPSLSAADAADALSPYWVGGEYLSAETVSDLGASAFHLINLWRALYGSSAGAHAANEDFLRLDAACFRMSLPPLYVGRTLYFRFVGAGETLASVVTYPYGPVTGAGAPPWHGFGFETPGRYLDNQLLGKVTYPYDTTWRASDPNSYLKVSPGFASTADAVTRFMDATLSVEYGRWTVPAGELDGVLTFATDPFVLPAGTPMLIFSPLVADTTYGAVTCRTDAQPS